MQDLLKSAEAGSPVLLLAAHIDDEVIGAATFLARWRNLILVHATDSSPMNLEDAQRNGFRTREEYAAARRRELQQALDIVGARHVQLHQIGIPDQQAALQLPRLTDCLRSILKQHSPGLVLTHPYEGGHPDHDACACALQKAAEARIPRGEFTSYHAYNGGIRTGEFLRNDVPVLEYVLSPGERARKQEALASFTTQRETLAAFRAERECLRSAPVYDFSAPPHEGQLYYECFNWGMTGARFRSLAAQ